MSFWEIVMAWVEIRETKPYGKIQFYIVSFFLGLFCVLIGAMGFKDVVWLLVIGGLVLWIGCIIEIAVNIFRNRNRW